MNALGVQGGVLGERSLRAWRLVAATPAGLPIQGLVFAMSDQLPNLVKSSVKVLSRGGYMEFSSSTRWGVWQVTTTSRTPAGELRPDWLDAAPTAAAAARADEADDADDSDVADLAAKPHRPADGEGAFVQMPVAPSSVFNLVQNGVPVVRAKVGRRGGRVLELSTSEEPPVAKREALALNWRAPAGFAFEAPSENGFAGTEATFAAALASAPASGGGIDIDAVHAAPVSQKGGLRLPGRSFKCSIASDGELYLFSDGRELILDLEHTRQLIHYLDHLRACDLVSAIEEQAA